MQKLKVRAYRPTFIGVSDRQLTAVGQGINASGDDFAFTKDINTDADIALIVSGPKYPGTNLCRAREKIHSRFAGRTLVSETPLFRQGAQPHEGPNPYFRLSAGGFMRDDGRFHPYGFQAYPSRWAEIKEEQSIEVKPWREAGGSYVLVCLQKPNDASLRGRCTQEWAGKVIEYIKRFTKLPIVVRAHPLDQTRAQGLKMPDSVRFSGKASLYSDMVNAHAVVTYTSLSAIESVLEGIPTFCTDPGNHAWPVSLKRDLHRLSLDVKDMGHDLVDRDTWLWDLAWSQWKLSELREGAPWRRLRPLFLD